MPVAFNFNLTFELKPQVGGIKIVIVSNNDNWQTIHFPSLVAHGHFDLTLFFPR